MRKLLVMKTLQTVTNTYTAGWLHGLESPWLPTALTACGTSAQEVQATITVTYFNYHIQLICLLTTFSIRTWNIMGRTWDKMNQY